MKQLSVSTFLETVERSGLVDKSRLSKSLSDLERRNGSSALGDSLVVSSHLRDTGLLTDWQSRQLLEGRHAGFFLGKYKLLDHLGTGGMSSVFLAEHEVMRRRVAIKVLPKTRVHDSSYLARFHREARAVAALDHPNIVRAFDVDHEGDIHYLVMEYIEGSDLKTLVERDGPLGYRTAADYIRQSAGGLGHAHQAGLIHRDMKPANLLVDLKGTVKILDMGLARFSDEIDASLTHDHDERMLGTVDFLAPEQALDSHLVDPRADIYSLGCTLYFLLTGQPPFPVGTLAQRVIMHQSKEPAAIADKRPDVPDDLVGICRRMMAKSVGGRYQSAEEVAEVLGQWIKDYDSGARRPARPAKHHDSDELKLAPLEDEPKRPVSLGVPSSASGSKVDTSIMARSDSTKVNRGEAIKDPIAVGGSGSSGSSGTGGQGSSTKPGGSSIKRAVGAPPGSSGIQKPSSAVSGPPGASGLQSPGGSKAGKPAGSPIAAKAPENFAPPKSVPEASALDGPTTVKKPGSSIKGRSTLPVAKPLPDSPKPASKSSAAAPGNTGSPAVTLSNAAAQQKLKTATPPPGKSPQAAPNTAPAANDDLLGPLDDLLTQMPPVNSADLSLSGGKLSAAKLTAGSSLAAPVKKPLAGKPSRWESPWFLILVGTGLGLAIIGLAVLVRVLSG